MKNFSLKMPGYLPYETRRASTILTVGCTHGPAPGQIPHPHKPGYFWDILCGQLLHKQLKTIR